MKVWKEYTIGQLCEVGRGSSPRPIVDQRYFQNGNIPWIKIADATSSGKYIYETKEYVNEYGASFSRYLEPNSLIIAASGTLGQINFLGVKGCIHDGWLYLSNYKEELIDKEYLYHFFKTIGKEFENLSYGAAIQNINTTILRNIKIVLPPLPTQQRIASILSAYDELIEVNNQRIKILEQTARELYKEWFVRMRFPGYKQAKFKKGIPDKWETKTLDEFGKIHTGKTPSTKVPEYYGGDIPFIKTPDLHRSLFVFETEERLTEKGNNTQKRSTLPANSICVSCIGTGGIVAITTAEKSQTNQQINSLIPSNRNQMEFLYYKILDLKETIELFGGTGATMTNLSKGKFEKLKILFPPKELVESYHNIVYPMFDQIKILQQQNTELRQIRDRLLPRLISGKLQVKAEKQEAKIVPLQNNSIQTEVNNKAKAYFKRRVLAAYIIDHLKDENTFGHVKLMKLMYLCEHLAKIETVSNYHRDAAGPYDNQMIRSIDSQLKKAKWFECIKENQKYTYRALEKKDEYKSWFTTYYAEYEIGITSLLNIFGKQKTIEAEKVATLYEAYRFLNEKKTTFTDKDILNEVLNNWHESKQRISENEWQNCLNWMREKKWIN